MNCKVTAEIYIFNTLFVYLFTIAKAPIYKGGLTTTNNSNNDRVRVMMFNATKLLIDIYM